MHMIQRFYFLVIFCSCIVLSVSGTIPHTNTTTALQDTGLQITSVACSPDMSPGYPFSISVKVRNDDSYNAGKFTLFFFLSDDPVLSIEDTFLGNSGLPLLYAGIEKEITLTDTFPDSIPDGIYYLITTLQRERGVSGSNQEILLNVSASPVTVIKKELPDQELFNTQIHNAIYQKTNLERGKMGLSPLSLDDELEKIAQSYAEKMAALRFIGHTDPEGNDQNDRAQAAGYTIYRYHDDGSLWRIGVGENLAKMPTGSVAFQGYINPTDPDSISGAIMKSWLESSGHRKNMMDPYADRLGIGVAYDGHYYYAVQEFF